MGISAFMARRITGEKNFFGPEDWRNILRVNLPASSVDKFPLDEGVLNSPCCFFPENGNGKKSVASACFHSLLIDNINGQPLTLLNLFSLAKERGFGDYFDSRFRYGNYNFANQSVCQFGWATMLKENPSMLVNKVWDKQVEVVSRSKYRVPLVIEETTMLFLWMLKLKTNGSVPPDDQWHRCADVIFNGLTYHVMVELLNGKINISIWADKGQKCWNVGIGARLIY